MQTERRKNNTLTFLDIKTNDGKYDRDKIIQLFCKVIIFAVSLSFLLYAFGEKWRYFEVDSFTLPTISLQYRQTLIITQADIDQAKIDYPDLYRKVDDYSSLRGSRLVKITDDEWLSFYFPIYPIICLPIKLILQFLGLDQLRAFTITNAIFIIFALFYIYKNLKLPILEKFIILILLILSPIYRYIPYLSAESMIFSLVAISMVLYHNKKYKSAAFFIAVASIPQPTVMAIGIVMFIDYFIKMFQNRKEMKIISLKNFFKTVKYGCCYIPCLIPFIFNFLMLKTGNPTAVGATLDNYMGRFLSYLFDINFGFMSFAPLILILFFVLSAISIIKKKKDAIIYTAFFFAPILAYSLMVFMNCAAIFCARYVMWTYPVLVFAIVILSGYFNIKTWLKYLVSLLLIISTSCFLVINNVRNDCFRFNNTSIFLLDNFPALYSPFYGTFYNRNDELILSYLVEEPSYYFSSNKNYLTKILFKSTDEYKKQILSTLYGDDDDISYLKEKINKIPSDNKYHYINISPLKNIKLDKYNIEQLGFVSENEVIFRTDEKIEIPASKKIETKKILTFNSKPYTLYKIDIEFDESTLPLKKDCLEFSINDIDNYYYNQIFARKNQYSLFLHTENNDISELIIESSNPESFVINNITITSMTNEVTVLNQNSPIEISGDMKEDEVVFKLDAQSFEYYKVMIELENPQDISNDDKFYLATRRNSFYYVHEPEFEIFEKSNTFIINSHDMTLTESSLEIVIVGETQKPIIINSIKIERTG